MESVKYFALQAETEILFDHIISEIKTEKNEKTAIICDNLCGLSVDIGILKLNDFNADVLTLLKDFKGVKAF